MDGAKLKCLREKAGKTRRQVAIEADITENQLLNIERGYTKNPRVDTASALAKAVGCDLADLLDEDE
jgi:transcriptional regulator with XRE-family HTH domain